MSWSTNTHPNAFTAADALALTDPDALQHPDSAALRDEAVLAARERWREQASQLPSLTPCPGHPDPHMKNYIIEDSTPILLDWDDIAISDPMRDVGIQIWGFLPRSRWAEFMRAGGISLSPEIEASVYWWSAFKMLTNAVWCDTKSNEQGAKFHADLFVHAVAQRPWRQG